MKILKNEILKIINNKYFIFILTLLIFFLSSLLQLIPIYIFRLNISELTGNTQILLNIFSNIICMLLLIFIYRKTLFDDFKEFKSNYKNILDKAFGIWVAGLLLMAASNLIINYISPNEIANNEKSIREMISTNPYLMLISTSILAPLIEELTFRLSFRKAFSNNIVFVVLSALVFGSLHVIGSVNNIYDYLYLIPYCSLGFAFSYMYYKTNNIFSSISMHMIHNLIITVFNILALGMIIW